MKIVVTGTRGIPNIMGGVETHEGVSKLSYSKKITKRVCQNSLILKKITKP